MAERPGTSKEELDEEVLNQQLQTGERLVLASDLIKFRGRVDDITMAAFQTNAKTITAKGRLSKADQAWLDDYMTHLPKLCQMLSAEDKASDSSQPADTPTRAVALRAAIPKIKLNELVIKPQTFNGTRPHPRKWLDDYEHAAEANRWTHPEMVCYFPTFLERTAMDWHISVVRPKLGLEPLWEDLRSAFSRHYLGDTDRRALRKQMEQCYQKDNEKATLFIPRILRIVNLVDGKLSEEEKVEIIRDKLRQEYRDKMVLSTLYTIEQLNDSCLRIEAEMQPARKGQTVDRPDRSHSRRNTAFRRGPREGRSADDRKQPADIKDAGRDKGDRSHGRRNVPPSATAPVRTCYRCGRRGHISKDCRAKSKADGSPCNQRSQAVQIVQQARSEEAEEPRVADEEPGEQLNYICMLVENGASNSLIKQSVRVNGKLLSAVVDSGAYCSVINSDVVCKEQWPVQRECTTLSHAAGGKLDCLGTLKATVSLVINRVKVEVKCQITVVKGLCTNFIMGIELIRALKLVIHPNIDRPLSLDKSVARKGVRTIKDETLPPRSVNFIMASVTTPASEVVIGPFGFDRRVRVANSLSMVREGQVVIQILNSDAAPVYLRQGVQVASIEDVKSEGEGESQPLPVHHVVPIADTQETIKIGDHLSPEQQSELLALLSKHQRSFSVNGSLGRTTLVHHSIELEPDSKPFKEPVRRHPPLHVKEVNKQVADMLNKGIIEPSCSPWASEYVVVRKKTGDYRICVDFRRLNALTVKNSFPLPRIDECLDSLNGNHFFTKLDFASGYWQVPVEPKSRPLTAFRTSEGLYQFRVLPFGLSNAPASFQALINSMFSGLKGLHLQVYLDDVCLATKTWTEHVEMLDQVFTIVSRANLKLKGSKCELAMPNVVFLGHLISGHGVQQDPEKMAALAKLPPPKEVSDVRRVLGAFGYYRKFVPNYAAITEPLSALTRKDVPFTWGEAEQAAFSQVKKELLKNATLASPSPEGKVVLKTDASLRGIAGIALQQQDGVWKLLACCSRNLNCAEKNYSITELEGLAAVYSIQKLRYLLLGRPFTLLVDHCALCVLNKNKAPSNSRLHRWALALSEYQFEVKHVKGEAHSDVDCLSRAPVSDEQDNFLPLLAIEPKKAIGIVKPVDGVAWRSACEREHEILRKAEHGVDGFYDENGVIYHKGKLFVPTEKRRQLLEEAHASQFMGHDGVEGTTKRLLDHFWWPGLRQEAADFVSTCRECQLRKSPRRRPGGTMFPHLATAPMDALSIDHLGKLPETLSGKRFVLVAVDVFSRFVFARACAAQTAEYFKSFLLDIVSAFGPPRKIITDNHQAFCAQECSALCKSLAIQHQLSAGRYHQGNAPVERAIQSLQDKLSVLSKDCEDWATALPFAVLGLNTRVCTATRYAPYELMFGRPVDVAPPSVQIDRPYSLFSEAVQVGAADLSSALASSAEAHSKSKERYDKGRPQIEFNVNDLVLVRVSDRAPKLNPRYEGPFQVLKKDNDIYQLVRVDNNKDKRMRHVSQLKAYKAPAVLLVGVVALGAIASPHLHETSPVFWIEDQDRFVSEGMMDFPYLLAFKSPCHYIREYAVLLDSKNRPDDDSKARNEIAKPSSIRLVDPRGPVGAPQQPSPAQPPAPLPQRPQPQQQPPQANMQPPPQYQQVPTNQQAYPLRPVQYVPVGPAQSVLVPPVPTPPYDEDLVEEVNPPEPSGQWISKEEAEARGLKRPSREAQIITSAEAYTNRCNELSAGIRRRMARAVYPVVERPRTKRQAAFILGLIVSDTISWIRQKLTGDNQASVDQLKQTIGTTTRKVGEKTTLLAVANKVLASNQRKIATQVAGLSETLAQLPSLEMFSEHILSGLESYEQLLDRLIISIGEGKLDTITLEQVFNVDQLEGVQVRDLHVQSLEPLASGVLKFHFHGHIRSKSTKIYKVHAFSYYGNLSSTPMRNDYVGKPTLVKNSTSNCVKAIDTTSSEAITEDCSTTDYLDPTLKLWRRTAAPNIWQETRHSTHMVAWPHILIYCWGNSIGLGQEKLEWTPCPTYVFRLNYTDTFRTSDNLVVHVAKSKSVVHEFNVNVVLDVHEVHFQEYEAAHALINKNLELVNNLTNQARQEVIVEVGEQRLTYRHATYSITSMVLVAAGIWLVLRVVSKCQGWCPRPRPTNLRKSVERQINQALHETRREVQIEMQEQVQTEVNRQLNSQLNKMVLDSRHQVARFSRGRPRQMSIDTISEVDE